MWKKLFHSGPQVSVSVNSFHLHLARYERDVTVWCMQQNMLAACVTSINEALAKQNAITQGLPQKCQGNLFYYE